MNKTFIVLLSIACYCMTTEARGQQVITSVVRANGASGAQPLPMEEGGVKDGNLMYSDRSDRVFAKTPTGTLGPAGEPLIGSEYVRTFDGDKNAGGANVTYTVTISMQAMVWITMDDRWNATDRQNRVNSVTSSIAPAGTFTYTGLKVYVGTDNDRPMSVYAAELGPGTYVFGPNVGNNFYSIGATASYDPLPASGDRYVKTTQATLSWTNLDSVLKCDLYFGTERDLVTMTKVTITNPAERETVGIPANYLPLQELTDYYWVVDSYYGVSDPNDPNNLILPDNPNLFRPVWTFHTNNNEAPLVGVSDQYLWHGKDGDPDSAALVFTPVVIDDGLPLSGELTYKWTQLAGPAVTIDPNDALAKDISLVLTELSNDYQFQMTVSDGDLTTSVTARVVLAADSCAASARKPGFSYSLGDINKDCYVNLRDFAEMALAWLECTDTGAGCR